MVKLHKGALMLRNLFLILILLFAFVNPSFAEYKNDLRTLFLNNQSVIYCLNIRSFNAQDTNKNGFIDEEEKHGNFINAIDRLDELKELGINTLHVLPITPTGKLKALGTAGSLYAISDFTTINPQLVSKDSPLSSFEQVKLFIDECHKRNIRVIIDLPSCGSYDLYLKHPELFLKDDKQLSIVPTDWTDVRLFNTGTRYNTNTDLLDVHKKFIDMIMDLGADGIRADVATIKPYDFWTVLINYARAKDAEFLYLAEASDSWREPPSKYAEFTPYDELLENFDGYYGSFFNLKIWKADDLINHVKFNNKLLKSYTNPKSVIMSFTTHDEVSPVVLHGEDFSVMIAWLDAVLPYNPYIIDGFQTGDDYAYELANTKAAYTETDDDTYFVHKGKLDIFNFSRRPGGKSEKILSNLKQAYKFRADNIELITGGEFIPVKLKDEKVFAFFVTKNNDRLLVVGNLDFSNVKEKICIKDAKFRKKTGFEIIHGDDKIKLYKKRMELTLAPSEIKVIKFK